MPPKKAAEPKKVDKGQQKALEKQKLKAAEDKTFGLKNKNKSKSVQKYVKSVQQAAKGQHNVSEAALKAQEIQQREEKKKEARQAALFAALFRGAETAKKIAEEQAQKKKTDPKSIKEDQQLDLYVDHRVQRNADGLAEFYKTGNPTIMCKHFLEAVEKKQCGWFWVCPGGGDACKYAHCLPEGYVLQRDQEEEPADDEDELWEDVIERKRAELPGEGHKLTLELFLQWKAKKEAQRKAGVEAERLAEQQRSGNRGVNALSGRDLFSFDPTLFVDDAGAADDADYEEDAEEWDRVLNANQAAVDEANKKALETEAQLNGVAQSTPSPDVILTSPDKSTDTQMHIQRNELFLQGDIPDLEELDS